MKITFSSNIVTQPFDRFLKKDFEIEHSDIDNINAVLQSTIQTDVLVLLLDSEYFFQHSIDADAQKKLDLVISLLEQFRRNNDCRILFANIHAEFDYHLTNKYIEQTVELAIFNSKIENACNLISNCYTLNMHAIFQGKEQRTLLNKKNKYMFQSPLTKTGFELVATEIKRKLTVANGPRKKVCVVDADNTLWGGIVGEDGVNNIAIDKNYPGVAYRNFQNQLLELKNSGILLALVSKNNEQDVVEVFEKRKLPLKLTDFITTRINWTPKSANVASIAEELNLGLESFVFIDDNPFEVEEVSQRAPGVTCIQANPDNPLENLNIIPNLWGFHADKITSEDENKTQLYRAEAKRSQSAIAAPSLEQYLRDLDIEITYCINNKDNISRISQLTNKTNQFNLTTKRYGESEIESLMEQGTVYDFRVSDKYGDMGIVGVAIVIANEIDTFLMSCRVLGRCVEETIFSVIMKDQENGPTVSAKYIPTKKNKQVESLYERLGMELVKTEQEVKAYTCDQYNSQPDFMPRLTRGN